MRKDSLETCLSGTVKQAARRFAPDIFSKLFQIHQNNRLPVGRRPVKLRRNAQLSQYACQTPNPLRQAKPPFSPRTADVKEAVTVPPASEFLL